MKTTPRACVLFVAFCEIGLAVLFLTACAKRETVVETGIRTQTLHVGNWNEPESLDPHIISGSNTSKIAGALFEGLVNLANDAETILPGVAERWAISPDGTVYTFHLRNDARWSNGESVTAMDFVESFQRFLTPAVGTPDSPYAFCIAGAQDFFENRSRDFATVGVRTPDTRTLVITLTHRAPYFLARLANPPFFPVPMRTVEKLGGRVQRDSAWTRPGNLVSNGAFMLKEWRPDVVLVAEKNPRYWKASQVRLREIRFYPIADKAAEEHAFRAGQLHVTDGVPPTRRVVYREHAAPELRTAPQAFTGALAVNVTRPPFDDARVRHAFSLAIDRARIVTAALAGFGSAAHSFTPPGTGGYQPPVLIRFDPGEARRLLAEAGFPSGAQFPAVELMLPGRDPLYLGMAEAIQEMWHRELGVTVTLATPEWTVYADRNRTKNFQLTYFGWDFWINDPVDLLPVATSGYVRNRSAWSNRDYDRAFAESEAAPSDVARRAAFDRMEALIATEAPYIPIFHRHDVRLVHAAVHGWRENALGTIDWRELWLEGVK